MLESVLLRKWIPENSSYPALHSFPVRWVFQLDGGEVHLEMLRASPLIAAAITSHCISLFYGQQQLCSSSSPFGASLETSASLLFTTSEPEVVPSLGGMCAVNMLCVRYISSQISEDAGLVFFHRWVEQQKCVRGPEVNTVISNYTQWLRFHIMVWSKVLFTLA